MNTVILDNKGETYDRYTIILSDGDCYGASDNPFHPMGFGQYCGNIAENYWRTAYGVGWRRGCDAKLIKKRVKFALNNYIAEKLVEGEVKIHLKDLPEEVIKYVKQLES